MVSMLKMNKIIKSVLSQKHNANCIALHFLTEFTAFLCRFLTVDQLSLVIVTIYIADLVPRKFMFLEKVFL